MKKQAILVLMTAVALSLSGMAGAGNLPEAQVGNGATPDGLVEDNSVGFDFNVEPGADLEVTDANMSQAQVGNNTAPDN